RRGPAARAHRGSPSRRNPIPVPHGRAGSGRCPTSRHRRYRPCAPARARRATAHSSFTPVRFHSGNLEHYARHLVRGTAVAGGRGAAPHLHESPLVAEQRHHFRGDIVRTQVAVGDDPATAGLDDGAGVEFLFTVPVRERHVHGGQT